MSEMEYEAKYRNLRKKLTRRKIDSNEGREIKVRKSKEKVN